MTAYLEFLLVVSFVIFELIISAPIVEPGSLFFASDLEIKILMDFHIALLVHLTHIIK